MSDMSPPGGLAPAPDHQAPQHDQERTRPSPAEDSTTVRPSATSSQPAGTPQGGGRRSGPSQVDRSAVIGEGLRTAAGWSLRLIIIGVALSLLLWLLGQVWVGIRPILFALILSTVLWPAVAWLRRHRWPAAVAAGTVLVTAVLAVVGVLALVTQPMVSQAIELADSAVAGIEQVQDWLTGPPVNLASERIDAVVAEATGRLRNSATKIAAGVFSGVSVVTSGLVTLVLVLVLTLFFVKDGPGFLPWLRREAGPTIGGHLTELLARAWRTLGDFSDDPGDRLHASAHAWAHDSATDIAMEVTTRGGERVEATTPVAEPGPLIAMKLQAIMNRAVNKQGTDLLDIVRLSFDAETRTAALSQIAHVDPAVASDIETHVDLWMVRQRQRSLQWIRAVGGADVTLDDIDLAAELLRDAAVRPSAY